MEALRGWYIRGLLWNLRTVVVNANERSVAQERKRLKLRIVFRDWLTSFLCASRRFLAIFRVIAFVDGLEIDVGVHL
ncbi:hypothetical protein SDJN02_01131, partial [Cucurbita argyrosperma subsp. argyrosperma]